LGPHRLICGDSRDAGVWEKLLGEERVQCVWTDPPYGVSYVGSPVKKRDPIENDSMDLIELEGFLSDVFGFLLPHTEPGCVWYVAGPNTSPCFAFIKTLLDLGVYKHCLIWLKNQGAFSRCDYHYQHEPIIYGWTPGGGHYWCGRRDLTSVLEFDRPNASPEHPTMKPPELIVHCLENSSLPGWIVCDPFGGSGSTLIASAMCGRVARLIELSPHYCDVIRRRWGRYAADNGLDPGPGAL
jgi:DNA modification methylase